MVEDIFIIRTSTPRIMESLSSSNAKGNTKNWGYPKLIREVRYKILKIRVSSKVELCLCMLEEYQLTSL